MPKILFNANEVIALIKAYKKHNESEDMDDYTVGIIQGLDFVLFLMEKME